MIEIVENTPVDPDADLLAFRNKVFDAAAHSVEWMTPPLVNFDVKTGLLVDIRTGVLIEIGAMRFLITAAHDLMDHIDQGRPLYVVRPDMGSKPIPLIQEKFWATKSPQEDIAVCQLHHQTIEALGDKFKYLHLANMMSQDDPAQQRGLHFLLGYPYAMMHPDGEGVKRADAWRYLTNQYSGNYANIPNYDPNLHIVLDYNKKTFNSSGKKIHPPGLSGCGIWFVGIPLSHPLFNKDDFKLVAIQTSWWDTYEYVKGTWINDALRVIWNYYSDTRSAMKLHGMSF